MKTTLMFLGMALIGCLGLMGCASSGRHVLPQYSVQTERLAEGPPKPAALPPGAPDAPFVLDQVQISTATAVSYHDLPSSVTQVYDVPPVDLSVKDVVLRTLSDNRAIKIQGYALRIAEYEIPVSEGIYDLLASANLAYNRTETQGLDSTDTLTISRSRTRSGQAGLSQLLPTGATLDLAYEAVHAIDNGFYAHQGTIGITQPLLRGFGWTVTNAGITLAKLERQGNAADYQTQVQDQLAQALKTYWDLIGAHELYKVQEISYAAALDLLRIKRAYYDVEMLSIADLLQAQAAAESRRVQLILARQEIRNLEDQLKRLLFMDCEDPLWNLQFRPVQPIGWRELPVDPDFSVALAMDQRPELRRALSNLHQAELDLKVAGNNLWPLLNYFGRLMPNGVGEDFDEGFDNMDTGHTLSYATGLEFSFPLQNRAARYRRKQAAARVAQAGEMLEDEKNRTVQDVRAAARAILAARERIAVTQSQIESEEANLATAMERYEVGLATTYNVLQFQQDRANAQADHVTAIIDANKAAVDLERAQGTLLDTYGIRVSGTDLNPGLTRPHMLWTPASSFQ